jgi:hemin uptake protein HemP
MSELGPPPKLAPPREQNAERPASPPGRRIASAALFQGHDEIVILHREQEYRLRITKADKLILTK